MGISAGPREEALAASVGQPVWSGRDVLDLAALVAGSRLVLSADTGVAHLATATVRTLFRQRHIVGFVDAWRHDAMGMGSMTPAQFAARLFRLGHRFVLLAKRSGLTLAFATQLLDQKHQLLDLRLESAILSQQLFIRRPDNYRHHRLAVRLISHRAHIGYTTRIQLAG